MSQEEEQPPECPREAYRRAREASQLPLHLDLWDFLVGAVEEARRFNALRKIYGGPWQSTLWQLVRLLKGRYPDGATGAAVFREVEAVMLKWAEAWPREGWPDVWRRWLGVGRADAQAEVLSAWDKVRYAPGESPLEAAFTLAAHRPLELPAELRESRPDSYPLFVGLAGWLQVVVGARPILLPLAAVAGLFHVHASTVSYYRRCAVDDGYLRELRKHEHRPGGKGKATELAFDVSRFPVLLAKAAQGTRELFEGAGRG